MSNFTTMKDPYEEGKRLRELERLRRIERAAWLYAMDDTPAADHFKRLDDLVEALRASTEERDG